MCLPLSSEAPSVAEAYTTIPYEFHFRSAGNQFGWNWRLLAALAKQESSLNPNARSRVGARGLLQIMPATGREIASDLGLTSWNLTNPAQSIQMGAFYLAKMRTHTRPYAKNYRDNIRLSLCAYNAGPTAVTRYRDCPPYKETQNYHRKIFAYWEQHKKEYLP